MKTQNTIKSENVAKAGLTKKGVYDEFNTP